MAIHSPGLGPRLAHARSSSLLTGLCQKLLNSPPAPLSLRTVRTIPTRANDPSPSIPRSPKALSVRRSNGCRGPGRAALPARRRCGQAMVAELKMETYQAAFHCRADRSQERELEDPISQQWSEQETVEHCRGSFQGKPWVSASLNTSLTECRMEMLASHMDALNQRCLRRWRNISTLFTFLAGNAPRRLPPQMNPRPTLLIIHTWVWLSMNRVHELWWNLVDNLRILSRTRFISCFSPNSSTIVSSVKNG